MEFKLISNIPHFENAFAKLNIIVVSSGNYESLVQIKFTGSNIPDNQEDPNIYRYYFSFDNKQTSISVHPWISIYSKINHFNQLVINGISYSNIFSISYDVHMADSNNAVFDTIYYNEKGFLKFISSQYGYNLERTD